MDNSEFVRSYLTQFGMTPIATAGIMGNLDVESGFNPWATNGTHTGLVQWDNEDRFPRFLREGGNPNSVWSQMDFAMKEAKERGLIDKLNAAKDPAEAATLWENVMEVSGGQAMKERIDRANEYYKTGQQQPVQQITGIQAFNNAQFQLDDPNEKLDVNGMMEVLNRPQRSVAAAQQEALQDSLLKQARHAALGYHLNQFFQGPDQAMMKMAMAKAEEDAKADNVHQNLTAAGKLAQMIANSHNSSNAKQYAAIAPLLGVQLDSMAGRYMSQNEAAGYVKKQNDQIEAEKRKLANDKELTAFATDQKMREAAFNTDEKIRATAALAGLGLLGSGGGGGGGSKAKPKAMSSTDLDKANKATEEFKKAMNAGMDTIDDYSWSGSGQTPYEKSFNDYVTYLQTLNLDPNVMKQYVDGAQNDVDFALKNFHDRFGKYGERYQYKGQ